MRKLVIVLGLLMASLSALGADMSDGADNFYKSDKVTMQQVTFKNQYKKRIDWRVSPRSL
jgi:heme oxygenase